MTSESLTDGQKLTLIVYHIVSSILFLAVLVVAIHNLIRYSDRIYNTQNRYFIGVFYGFVITQAVLILTRHVCELFIASWWMIIDCTQEIETPMLDLILDDMVRVSVLCVLIVIILTMQHLRLTLSLVKTEGDQF